MSIVVPSMLKSHLSCGISTRAKEDLRNLKKPPNSPVQLKRLPTEIRAIFNNHQVDIKDTKIIQKDFSSYKERRVAETPYIV